MQITQRHVWTAATIVCLIVLLGYATSDARRKRAVPFEMFFSSSTISQSVRWVASGKKRPIIGGGSYVLAFKIPRNEVGNLATNNGFVAVNINDNPNHWRLSLCNSVISDIVSPNITITPEFEAYSKECVTNSTRLFYNANQELAVVIGFGTFYRPGLHRRY
jgi:hypothetical protein